MQTKLWWFWVICPNKTVHCLGWCHIMNPCKKPVILTYPKPSFANSTLSNLETRPSRYPNYCEAQHVFLKRKKAQVDFRVKNTFYGIGGFTVLGNYYYYLIMNRFVSVFGEFWRTVTLPVEMVVRCGFVLFFVPSKTIREDCLPWLIFFSSVVAITHQLSWAVRIVMSIHEQPGWFTLLNEEQMSKPWVGHPKWWFGKNIAPKCP